jgi:hypothetical protein
MMGIVSFLLCWMLFVWHDAVPFDSCCFFFSFACFLDSIRVRRGFFAFSDMRTSAAIHPCSDLLHYFALPNLCCFALEECLQLCSFSSYSSSALCFCETLSPPHTNPPNRNTKIDKTSVIKQRRERKRKYQLLTCIFILSITLSINSSG